MRRATGAGEVKSKAKPLREVSRNRVNPTKTVIRKNKKAPQSELQAAGEDNEAVDRPLSIHRDLSAALHLVDELVMQAFKAKPTNKQVTKEIEFFANVLSEFLCSLKLWVPKFQKVLSGVALEPENQSTQISVTEVHNVISRGDEHGDRSPKSSFDDVEHRNKSPKPCLDDVEHGDISPKPSLDDVELGDVTPKESLEEQLVSPSPLVLWRAAAGTTPEESKQLFLLTPQPRTGIPVTKGQHLQKAVAFDGATAHTPHLPSATIGGDMLLGELINQTSRSYCTSVDKKNTCIYFSPVIPKIDYSAILSTPRLKASPPKPCVLLDPDYGFSLNNFDSICQPTPSLLKTRIVNESPNPGTSYGRVSEMLDLKYPVIVGLDSSRLLENRKKQLEISPTWVMSPPKTCTLMEPSDEKSIKDASLTCNHKFDFDPASMNDVGAHCHEAKKVANDGYNSSSLGLIESTPMLKASESAECTGRLPGENTLKKELWTRFEAVSALGVRPNSSHLQWTAGKGFLDQLEEASSLEWE